MKTTRFAFGLALTAGLGCASALGCAAGATGGGGSGGTMSGSGGSASTFSTTSSNTSTGAFGTGSGGSGGFGACAKFSDQATQAPAAMLIVLDRTASMSENNKWGAAQIAVIKAIDSDVFDTMSLGLLTFPAPNSVMGPACIFGFPIYCAVSALPQVAVQPAGTNKSNASSGVRHDIYTYLTANSPESDDSSDSSPIYASLNGAYQFIQSVPNVDKRIVLLITDGGGSCTSVSSPQRAAYTDENGCEDWEVPTTMSQLISDAHNNATTPIDTFVVGVPGSNSTGNKDGNYDTPPYSMLLALSTYAVAGSPETLDPGCDKNLVFAKNGNNPTHPCHIDLSGNGAFDANTLATAIANIRGKELGCTYDLPAPPNGQTIKPDEVNVVITVDGKDTTIPKRKDASDMCTTTPCWDYDSNGKVELIGIACTDVDGATDAKVEVVVGCSTIIN